MGDWDHALVLYLMTCGHRLQPHGPLLGFLDMEWRDPPLESRWCHRSHMSGQYGWYVWWRCNIPGFETRNSEEKRCVHCIHASENLENFHASNLKHKATGVSLVLMFSLVHQSECDEFRHDLCWIADLGGRNLNSTYKFELKIIQIKLN
jgi:hypothetical protein